MVSTLCAYANDLLVLGDGRICLSSDIPAWSSVNERGYASIRINRAREH
jgi:hypothetical protein